MKRKLLIALLTAAFAGALAFSEPADIVVRYGLYGQGNFIFNGHQKDADMNVGGGLSFEFGMPFAIWGKQNGFALDISFNPLIMVKAPVESGHDIDLMFKYWLRFPFGLSDFAFQPELGYGLTYKTTESPASTTISDQKFTVGLSFRWNPVDVAKGMMEFDLTPQFSMETFNSPLSIYAGARLGCHMVFGRNAKTDEKIASREGKIIDSIVFAINSDDDLNGAVSVYRSAEGITLSLDSLAFVTDTADLATFEYAKLDKLSKILKKYDNTIHVVGHCEKTADGAEEAEIESTKNRAQAVANYLIQKKIRKSALQISASGAGSSQPRGNNDTEAGRKANRRIEIILVRKI